MYMGNSHTWFVRYCDHKLLLRCTRGIPTRGLWDIVIVKAYHHTQTHTDRRTDGRTDGQANNRMLLADNCWHTEYGTVPSVNIVPLPVSWVKLNKSLSNTNQQQNWTHQTDSGARQRFVYLDNAVCSSRCLWDAEHNSVIIAFNSSENLQLICV